MVANFGIWRDLNILVQDGMADLAAPADVAIIEDDAILHQSAGMHFNAAAEHRVLHHAAGQDAAAGHDAVDRLPTPVLVVKRELRRRVGIAAAAKGPRAII